MDENQANHQQKYELLKSITYRSRPLRWKLRKVLQKEKESIEDEIKKLEEKRVDEKLIQKNKEILALLEELTETFRPALIHDKPLEMLRKENKKAMK